MKDVNQMVTKQREKKPFHKLPIHINNNQRQPLKTIYNYLHFIKAALTATVDRVASIIEIHSLKWMSILA